MRPTGALTERIAFGNVNDQPLEEIWANPAYAEFRARVLRGDFPAECALCLMKHDVVCANAPLTPGQFLSAFRASEAPHGRPIR